MDAVSELLSVPDVGATIGDSPFAVTATLDYLDVTWRLHTGAPLVVLPGANRTARLESDVHTPAELDGALNAIYEVLTRLNVPKGNGEGHGLTRLRSWCSTNVDANDADRVEHAIDLLAAVIDLRNARQHNDTKPSRASERDACATLSIAWPIYDAPTTWRLVQSRCAYA